MSEQQSNKQYLSKCLCFKPLSTPRRRRPQPQRSKLATPKQYYKVCFCFRRIFRIRGAEPPNDVKQLFESFSENGNMSVDQLLRFLIEFQGEKEATQEGAQAIFDSLKLLDIFQRKDLHLQAFFRYLLSDLNPPLSLGVHHDMNAPLAQYFVYTGHNSYLTGNQLSSECSVEPIIKALERGVRVIELDIWPNQTNDDVIVCHGGTLTTPVELIMCLESIKKHAFSASPYPVIITLEDHLTPDLQYKVAKMLIQTFGNMLFHPKTDLTEFPSPEELKHHVIISTKPPKAYPETKTSTGHSSLKRKDSDVDMGGKKPLKLTADQGNDDKSDDDKSDGISDEEDDDDFDKDPQSSEPPAYSSLITIHAGKPKGGLKKALEVEIGRVRRLSLSEQQLRKAAETCGMDVVRFTQKNILRVYPKGTRVTSSNYKPHIGWMHGAQMVAFNMQGYGKSLWLMHGMFRSNGGCGYVKKPDILMQRGPHDEVFNPKETLPVNKTLKVKVYLGEGWHLDFKKTHFDLYSPPDFYARVGIAGVPADVKMMETGKKEDNWTPVWDKEFTFPLTVPELALLRIEVYEYDMSEKDDFAGQTCLPVSELREGIRAVPLYDLRGTKYNSVRVLVGFQFV